MIKRIRFLREPDPGRAASSWHAPATVRPTRAVLCTTRTDLTPRAPVGAIGIESFRDVGHHVAFADWLASAGVVDDPARLLVAQEHVARGAEWLTARWADPTPRLKHMAIARRAAGLTPQAFGELWRSRAGRVGATPVPEEARGLAYVQNHPIPASGDDWAYDAVNEVWFDDEHALRVRMSWFAETLGDRTEDDLVRESWFVAAREEVVHA